MDNNLENKLKSLEEEVKNLRAKLKVTQILLNQSNENLVQYQIAVDVLQQQIGEASVPQEES